MCVCDGQKTHGTVETNPRRQREREREREHEHVCVTARNTWKPWKLIPGDGVREKNEEGRERERERDIYIYIHTYIHTSIER